MFKAIILALLMASTVQAQTVEELQAQIDSIKAVKVVASSQVKADSLVAQRDSAIVVFGITFYADSVDSQYVQIDFPLSTATGFKRALVLGSIEECISDLGAKQTEIVGRLRIRHDKAKRATARLNNVLTQ